MSSRRPAGERWPEVRLSLWAIDHPAAVFAAAGALILLALPGLFRLGFRLDPMALVPQRDPAVAADRGVRERFGIRDRIVLLVEREEGGTILRPDSLARIREATSALADLDGVEPGHLRSLATEPRDRVDSLDASPYLSPPPRTEAEIEALRADLEAAAVPIGTLVATDLTAATILLDVPPGADRERLYEEVAGAAAAIGWEGERVHVVGAPVAEVLLGRHLVEDLTRLLPLSLGLVALTLGLAFRRPWAVILPLAEAGCSILFTFGLLGWSGRPVLLTTTVLPVILASVGLADEIHLLAALRRQRRRQDAAGDRELTRAVMIELARPVAVTSVTTAVGFLSFLASDLPPVRSFGLWAAVGVLFCMAWSLTVTPAALARLDPDRVVDAGAPNGAAAGVLRKLAAVAGSRGARAALAAALVLLALGALRLEVQDGWISGFAEGSEFRRSVERADRLLLGTHLLHAEVDLAASGGKPLLEPRAIAALGRLEETIRRQPGVGGVLGPYSHLAAVTHLARGRPEGPRLPPDDAEQIRRMWRYYELGRGVEGRREVVADGMDRGLVTVFLEDANYRDTARVMAAIRDFERRELRPLGGRVTFAGDVAVSQAMIGAIVRGQLASLAVALAGLLVLLTAALRSLREALWAVLPAALAGAAALGCMGWLGIPLGVATSMFLAITLGIGVDYPVHLLEARRRARLAGAAEPLRAARAEVGPALVIDAVAVAAGFGLLGASQVPANARLGLLVAVAVATSCAVTLLGPREKTPAAGGLRPK